MNLLQSFTEFEAFTESVRDADMRMSMPSLEVSRWSLRHLEIDSVHIQVGSEGSGNIAEGAIRRDGWIFYIQTSGSWGLANGQRIRPNTTILAEPGSEFCFASPDKHNWCSVFLPTSLVAESRVEDGSILCVENCQSRIRINQTRRMQELVERLLAAVAVDPAVLTAPATVTAFQEEIRSTAVQQLSLRPLRNVESGVPRQELIKSAVEYIDDDQDCSLTIVKLAESCRVSERTLRSAFCNWYGVSPLRYLLLRRMHDARRVLRSNRSEEVTVAQVAIAHGFWDLGRFAGRYHKLFGERPSDTLRKPPLRK